MLSAGEAAESSSDQEEEQKHVTKEKVPSQKRVGRPLAYTGDPDADPDLSDKERRKIKRWVQSSLISVIWRGLQTGVWL